MTRLIDADALSKKLCETTIFIKGGEMFQRMINDAPTIEQDGDLIRRQEVIIALRESGLCYNNWLEVLGVIDSVPNATSQSLTKPNKSCEDDLISRQAAIDAVANGIWHFPNECYQDLNDYGVALALAMDALASIPPVTPTERTGEWINTQENQLKIGGYSGYCSVCHEWSEYLTDYCGKCGAYMVKENE